MAIDPVDPQTFEAWLKPLSDLVPKTRRLRFMAYVLGLLGPSERKNVQQMTGHLRQVAGQAPWIAGALGRSGHKNLERFVSNSTDDEPLWEAMTLVATTWVGRRNSCIVIDEVVLPKKGTGSVGVARQAVGPNGERSGCQVGLLFMLTGATWAMPVAWRLILPEEWTRDPARCVRAGVPIPTAQTGCWEAYGDRESIVLGELRRLREAEVPFVSVMIGADYVASPTFCQGLDNLKASWVVPVEGDLIMCPIEAQEATAGGRMRRTVDGPRLRKACTVPTYRDWTRLESDSTDRDPPKLAVKRVKLIDGAFWAGRGDLRAKEMSLLVGWLAPGEKRYFMTDLRPRKRRDYEGAAVRARWACDRARARMKCLGQEHFEGRSWHGLHRHMLMVSIGSIHPRSLERRRRDVN